MIRLALAALALAASASVAMAATALIRGVASFDAETPPPPGSTLEVELLDLDAATPAGQRRAEASVPVRRRGSVAFVISYDPTAIDPGHRHVLAVRLVEGKRTLFRADPFPILTAGAGNVAVIPMVSLEARKPAAPADPAVLAGTWTAEEIGGEPRSPGVASFVTLSPDGTLRGRGGCNSFSGSYEIAGGVLKVGPVAATRRACPPAEMDQEARFFAALEAARGFRMERGLLVLTDAEGKPVARLDRQA